MGKMELIALVVLAIVVLFVGAKKLPELARAIGQSGKELKKGFKDVTDDEMVAPVIAKVKSTRKV
jgi:TatA/E family protein of Tat protein translocase